ncbi:uncharacterized protein LOC119600994 [Lucilia sericata]|uniref:uncharacterized protein LOC119600994 n=1 Tax=Lucilia sericata TaxID=13632 RepID=UPI0018A7EF48|nr:uncharacterized protein LOC119600994 [Lucilia sericata]
MVNISKCEIWNYFDNIVEEGIAVCKLCKQRLKNERGWILRRHLKDLHNAKSEIWNYFDNIVGEGVAVCKKCKQRVQNNRSSNLTQHMKSAHNIVVSDIIEESKRSRTRASRPRGKSTAVYISDEESKESSHGQVSPVMEETIPTAIVIPKASVSPTPVVSVAPRRSVTPNHLATTRVTPSPTMSVNPTVNNYDLMPKLTPIVFPKKPNTLIASKRIATDEHSFSAKRSKNLLAIDMNEKTLMSAIWGLLTEDGVSPTLFGSKNMQALIRPICQALLQQERKEIKIDEAESEKLICLVANHLRNRFSNEFESRLLSLKIDMDLNGPENTFCVSTAFVDCGQLQTRLLGIIDLKNDSHLSEQHIKQILHKFNIDSNQVISICWDNSKANYNKPVKNTEYLEEIAEFEQYPDVQFCDIKLEPYVGDIAQLCILDILKNSSILEKFLECRNFVKYLNDTTNGCYEIFEQNNLKIPQLDSPYKWGSTYEMIHDLHLARNVLSHLTYPKLEHPEDQFNVNEQLWLFIKGFCESLSLMQKSIIKFNTADMHFGDFYAQWLKTKLLTANLASANGNFENAYTTALSTQLLNIIEARTKELLDKDCFDACLYLDPRFHHTLSVEKKAKALNYLKEIWSRSNVYKVDVINAAMEDNMAPKRLIDDEDAFLNEFLSHDAPKLDIKTTDIHKEIEGLKLPFKSVDTNILAYWNKLKLRNPDMYALSAICFAIPATQNYNLQRYAHIYQTQNIENLSTFTRDNIISIRLNSHLLKGNLEKFGIYDEIISCEDEQSEDVQIVESNEESNTSFY